MFMLGKVRYPDIEGMNILLICPDEKSLSFSKNSEEEEEDAGLFDNNIHALYGTRDTSSGVSANAETLSLSGTRHPLGSMQKFQALHPSQRAQVAQHPRLDPAMVYNLGIIVVPLNTVELSMILHPVTRIPPWMTCTEEGSPEEEEVHADTEGSQGSSSCASRRLCRFILSLNIMLNLLWREEDPVLRHSTDKVKDKHKSNQIQRALILLLLSVIDPIYHEWLYVFSAVIRTHDGDCVSMD